MNEPLKLLDVVALIEHLAERGLVRGHVGTIVEVYELGVFEVEFSDNDGQTYALATLRAEQLMALHHKPVEIAASREEEQQALPLQEV